MLVTITKDDGVRLNDVQHAKGAQVAVYTAIGNMWIANNWAVAAKPGDAKPAQSTKPAKDADKA